MVQAALVCGESADPVRRELARRRAEGQSALRERLERARDEGDLPDGSDPADLAAYVFALQQGMAVQAAGGATKAELNRIAALAIKAWPT